LKSANGKGAREVFELHLNSMILWKIIEIIFNYYFFPNRGQIPRPGLSDLAFLGRCCVAKKL